MIAITLNKGFQLFFDNGFGVSVQIGAEDLCSNNDSSKEYNYELNNLSLVTCKNAEFAVLKGTRENFDLVRVFDGGQADTDGWVSAEKIAVFIGAVAIAKSEADLKNYFKENYKNRGSKP
jgi:hypothetical protein